MQDGIRVFRLNFPFLTSSNLAQCRQFFDAALAQPATGLVIDLGPLEFFDSNGFAGLLRCIAKAMRVCEVRLCSSSRNVHALFQLMRGNSVLNCYWSYGEALQSFADSQDLVRGGASRDFRNTAESRPRTWFVATAGN